jgi:ubiquinone/menaquinone biosynthesis C-methylase UbiE
VSKQSDEIKRIEQTYDRYVTSSYGNKWSDTNPGNHRIKQEQEQTLKQVLTDNGFFPAPSKHVLDIGCGVGRILNLFQEWGTPASNLVGVDLLPERIEAARANHPQIRFECANAAKLEFADSSFDVVCFFVVFSSVLDQNLAAQISAEATRVLKPGGLVVWYDFRYESPGNQSVRAISKANISALFPGFVQDLRLITLVPPVARRLGPLTDQLYPILTALPFLRTHYLGVLKKPS